MLKLILMIFIVFYLIGFGIGCNIVDIWSEQASANNSDDRKLLEDSEIFYIYEYGGNYNSSQINVTELGQFIEGEGDMIKVIYKQKIQRVELAVPGKRTIIPTDKVKIKIHRYNVLRGTSLYIFTVMRGNSKIFFMYQLGICQLVKSRGVIRGYPVKALWIENYTMPNPMVYFSILYETVNMTRLNISGFKDVGEGICDQFVHYFDGCPMEFSFVFLIGIAIGAACIGSFFLITFLVKIRFDFRRIFS